jgi:hypothetical protein
LGGVGAAATAAQRMTNGNKIPASFTTRMASSQDILIDRWSMAERPDM